MERDLEQVLAPARAARRRAERERRRASPAGAPLPGQLLPRPDSRRGGARDRRHARRGDAPAERRGRAARPARSLRDAASRAERGRRGVRPLLRRADHLRERRGRDPHRPQHRRAARAGLVSSRWSRAAPRRGRGGGRRDDRRPLADARFQTEVERPDGSVAAVEVSARALRSGRGMQIVVLGRDVTERREQERERERLLARSAPRAARSSRAQRAPPAGRRSARSSSARWRLRSSLGEVAELIVRDLADVVAIDVIPRRGDQLERSRAARPTTRTRRARQRTLGRGPSASPSASATVEVARSGVPRWEHGVAARRSDGGARARACSRPRSRPPGSCR